MTDEIPAWQMKGVITGDCNCAWGCPCNFDAPPTFGDCEGVYAFRIDDGRFGDVDLAGVSFLWYAYAPGAIHEGNMTSLVLVDSKANEEQYEAINTLTSAGNVGMPFDGFVGLTSKFLETARADIEFDSSGDMRSTVVRADGGDAYELVTGRVRNPVTGEEEELYLDKPTGFTSLRSELGTSTVSRFNSAGVSYDNTDRYAEVAKFEYSGP